MLPEVGTCVQSLSHVRLFVTPGTVAHQTPLSMGFSRQDYWSGLPFPSPGDLPNPGIEPRSSTLQADSLPAALPEKPYKLLDLEYYNHTIELFSNSNIFYLKNVYHHVLGNSKQWYDIKLGSLYKGRSKKSNFKKAIT